MLQHQQTVWPPLFSCPRPRAGAGTWTGVAPARMPNLQIVRLKEVETGFVLLQMSSSANSRTGSKASVTQPSCGKRNDFEQSCGIVVKVLRGFHLRNPAASGVILPKTVYVTSKILHNGDVFLANSCLSEGFTILLDYPIFI